MDSMHEDAKGIYENIESKMTHVGFFFAEIVFMIAISHSARRPRTSREQPHFGPYVSFPDVLIRRGRRKDVASTSRIGRTNDVLRTPGRKKTSGKLTYGPKLGRPLDVTSE